MPFTLDTEGAHPATIASLEALHWLHERHDFANILEIGSGNGILAIAAANIWDAQVLAADISEQAVADTSANIAAYQLENQLKVVRSDGFGHPAIAQNAPYDLIICNLLADTHLKLALELKKHSTPDGWVLLSGILSWRAADVEAAYSGLGFEIIEKSTNSPWQSYLLCHNSHT